MSKMPTATVEMELLNTSVPVETSNEFFFYICKTELKVCGNPGLVLSCVGQLGLDFYLTL